jgi:hypothetical protein
MAQTPKPPTAFDENRKLAEEEFARRRLRKEVPLPRIKEGALC